MPAGDLSPSGLKLSKYRVVTRPIFAESVGIHKRVLFSTRTARAYVVADATWALLERTQFDSLSPAARDMLIDGEVLVREGEDELQHVISRNNRAAQQAAILGDFNSHISW